MQDNGHLRLVAEGTPPAEGAGLVLPPSGVEPVGLGYVYRDPRYGVALHFRRVQRGKEPSAELAVMLDAALDGRPLLVNGINLLGAGKKREIAKTLAERAAVVPVWPEVIEAGCQAVLAELRTVRVQAAGRVAPSPVYRPDRIRHLVREGVLSLLYGPGGVGKGWLAIYGAMCVQQGQPLCGLPVQQGSVLYLDWEDDLATFDARIAVVAKGTGLAPVRPHYLPCQGRLADMLDGVLDYVAEHRIALVVIDSVSKAFPRGDYSSYEATADELAETARLLPTTWAIDHLAGGAVQDDKLAGKPIGGIGKVNAARVQWETRGHQDAGACALWLALHQTKRNHTAGQPPLAFALTFDKPEEPTAVQIAAANLRDIPELARQDSLGAQADEALAHARYTYGQLFEELGIEDDRGAQQTVRATVARKVRLGTYRKDGEGRGAVYWKPTVKHA